MDQIRNKFRYEHEERKNFKPGNKYLTLRDKKSCQEITLKIEKVIDSERNFIHFGDYYKNFKCEEFNLLKDCYQDQAEFHVSSSVSNMKKVYNPKTLKQIK
jgi:hypothetical protein